MTEDWTQAEIVRSLQRIEAGLEQARVDLKTSAQSYVTRDDFATWRSTIGREIGEVKTASANGLAKLEAEIDARHAPWWSIVTAMAAVAAVLITVVPLIAR